MTENIKTDPQERQIPDQKVRDKIVLELDRTILVEAGAGSGKTKSLVDRMLALLREGKCTVETLAAVTFTRKAAAELRGRFQTELEENIRAEENSEVRRRLLHALQNLEQCYIGTIHSFCARILRERPIEIALDPEFEELEEIEDAIFREKSWFDYLLTVRLDDFPVLQQLDEVGLAPEDLRDAYMGICTFPEVGLAEGRSKPPDYARYRTQLEGFLERARKIVPMEKPEKGFDGLMSWMRRCFMRQKNLGFDDHRFLMETFELLDRENIGYKKTYWPDKEEGEAFKAEFDRFQEDVIRAGLREWREHRHSIILNFLRPAVRFYALQRKSQSLVNFEDLLMMTSRLLRDNPEVRRYFSRKFTHILVDEFQDTDPIQAEVMMYLTGRDAVEKDWRKLEPRPGSLFVVGDPKQSIFRFRRADIDIYNLVKEQIVRTGGIVLPLTANFRSMDAIRDWVNPVFENVFPGEFTRYQAAYAPLYTLRPEVEKTVSGVFKITVPSQERHKQEPIAQYDAVSIAGFIQWACAGNMKLARSRRERLMGLGPEASPGDFMLLFRYKKNMQIYARALEERGIPFEITGGGAFAGSEEIREIVNLARALVDPENAVYTVAVLRGIFFGASDNELLDFKRKGGRFSYLQRFDVGSAAGNLSKDANGEVDRSEGRNADRGGVEDEDSIEVVDKDSIEPEDAFKNGRIVSALETMRRWWQWTKEYPASTALEKIFEESGIVNYLASAEMGSSKAGNVFKLLEILRAREREASFAGLVDFMLDLTTVYDIEEMSLSPGRTDAVRLMNLHKAKGLEAPVVFLANPVGMRPKDPDRHVMRTDKAGPEGYFVFSERGKYHSKMHSQPVNWREKKIDEKEYQEAEEMRLMYVAATRARNILVVSTYPHGKQKERAWAVLDDALGDVPELEIPVGSAVELREKLVVERDELKAARAGLEDKVTEGNRPGYKVETVTALAKEEFTKDGRELPDRARYGLGMSWGRVVHSVLNTLGKVINREIGNGKDTALGKEMDKALGKELDTRNDKKTDKKKNEPLNGKIDKKKSKTTADGDDKNLSEDDTQERNGLTKKSLSAEDIALIIKNVLSAKEMDLLIENALAAEDMDLREKGRLQTLIDNICSSKLWQRALKAEKRLFEVPFSLQTESRQLGLEGNLPVILGGAIDLVFKEKDGWVIADYKTDEIVGDLQTYIDYYAPQIRLYSRFWAEITGEPVKESGLYFTFLHRWIAL